MTAGMKRGFSTVNALLIVVAVLFVAADALYGVMYYGKVRDCLNEHVVIETGSDIDLSLFVSEQVPGTSLVTDVSLIDTMVPGSYGIKVKTFGVTRDAVLDIVDTTAPTGTAVPQVIF